jgi:hypothetical protein
MRRTWYGKRITVESGARFTLQDLSDFLEMACRADLPPTARVRVKLNGVELDRFTMETEMRRDVP